MRGDKCAEGLLRYRKIHQTPSSLIFLLAWARYHIFNRFTCGNLPSQHPPQQSSTLAPFSRLVFGPSRSSPPPVMGTSNSEQKFKSHTHTTLIQRSDKPPLKHLQPIHASNYLGKHQSLQMSPNEARYFAVTFGPS